MTRINVYTPAEDFEAPALAGWFDRESAHTIEGRREWDGDNMADVHVGANRGQILYRTRGGRWVLHNWSNWVKEQDTYEFVTGDQAREWLIINESDDEIERWFGELEPEKGPGRPEIGPEVKVVMPADLIAWLDRRAEQDGTNRSALIRDILTRFRDAESSEGGVPYCPVHRVWHVGSCQEWERGSKLGG